MKRNADNFCIRVKSARPTLPCKKRTPADPRQLVSGTQVCGCRGPAEPRRRGLCGSRGTVWRGHRAAARPSRCSLPCRSRWTGTIASWRAARRAAPRRSAGSSRRPAATTASTATAEAGAGARPCRPGPEAPVPVPHLLSRPRSLGCKGRPWPPIRAPWQCSVPAAVFPSHPPFLPYSPSPCPVRGLFLVD